MSKDEDLASESNKRSLWDDIANRESQLLALVQASAQIVWLTDATCQVHVEAPQSVKHLTWSAFTGMDTQATQGHGWLTAIHRDDAPLIKAALEKVSCSDAPFEFEFRVRHRSGNWHWMLSRGNPIRASDGVVAGWIGTCTDITAQKQTEEALRQSQQRLVAALEAGEMGTWIWNFTDNTFWWDDAAIVLWGRVGNEEHEHNIDNLLRHIHEADRDAAMQAMRQFVVTGTPSAVEFRALRPDGALQWIASRGSIERDASGTPLRAVGAFVDITKIKVAEESLRQAQKMQALGTLAGGIAHDFNNLLLAINGNARLAIDEVGASHAARTSLEEIVKASVRATDLVRRILAFSASAPRDSTATPLIAGVQEALNLVRLSVPQSIDLQTHIHCPPISIALGATELHQVTINLVTNAMHAIGDQRGIIEISLAVTGDHAHITVRDTGCGMDSVTRARAFDPFFTTKPTGHGTGLGLAVVHGIVESAGGTIDVESELGRGSTFTVNLSIAPSLPIAAEASAAIERVAAGEHILYVDDDDAVVSLIERTLLSLGYRVTGSTDPAAAVRAFTASPRTFDVVITDLSMPGMNGFDVARAIKQASATTPVVLTSGYVRAHDHEQAAALGIEHVILKPNTIDEMGHVLDTLCKQLKRR